MDRDYKTILLNRIRLNELCKTNYDLRATALNQCKNDKIFWFDHFTYTYDPRKNPSIMPFILYPKQILFIYWLDEMFKLSLKGEKINAVVDKPRDIGFTFTLMGWLLWYWLFGDLTARVGSRKEEYVDKRGESDTLFFKSDFILENLPLWMQPPDWKKHRGYMILKHPTKENAISGESANPNFGRGGRKTISIFDEFGFWAWARSSWESAGETTNFRLAASTPPETGRDSHFFKLLTGQKGRIKKFSFDWTDVPERNEKWLAEKKATMSEEEFQRETLKSFEGSFENKVYASDLMLATFNECDYNPKLPLFVSWDFGLDEVAILWIQKDFSTNWLYVIDAYNNSNKPIDFYFPFVNGRIQSGVFEYSKEDLKQIDLHRKWKTATHYGDPDVAKRSLIMRKGKNPVSTKEILIENGIYVQTKSRIEHHIVKEKVRLAFRRMEINEVRCEYFIDCVRNARYAVLGESSQVSSERLKPIHNFTSHFRSCLEYFIDNEPKGWHTEKEQFFKQQQEKDFDKFAII